MTFRFSLCCLFILALSASILAQELLHIRNGCHFDGDENERELYAYAPSNEAQQIISRITAVMGLEQNFNIKAANVANALATVEGEERYVLYNTSFLEKIKSGSGTYWAAYCVLAHEIGHHLNFHKFSETDPQHRKKMELKADFFAGSTLQKMGATLDEAQAGINTFSLTGESNTHPPKSARLEAVASGWKQAKEGANFKVETPQYVEAKTVDNEALANDYLKKGIEAELSKNWDSAKNYYEKTVKVNPKLANAWHGLGVVANSLGKYTEAIANYDQAISLKPDFAVAFHNRGLAKYNLSKYIEAIIDFNEAIRLKPDYINAFHNRGLAKYNLSKYTEAVIDFNEAIRLKPDFVYSFNGRGNAKRDLGKYTEAIADYDEAIRFDPKFPQSYANKGCALVALGKYGAAIDSIREAEKLNADFKISDWAQKCKQEALSKLKD